MRLLPEDERGLQRALTLAREAAAFASPNPAVGCVIVRDGQTLGEGAHFYDARDHAEIAALQQAAARGLSAQAATAYVTLEPCSHHGRTGPCADALLAAGVSRCVIATIDANPVVRGQGLAKLRSGGVDVIVADADSQIAQEARRLNDAFAFAVQHGRPFITLKAAVSVDGFLAPPPATRQRTAPFWLTGPAARADVQELRHASDAILTGVGTVLADNPSLTDRTGKLRRRPLLRVVLDSRLRTPLDAALLKGVRNDLLLVASHHPDVEAERRLRAQGADVVRVPANSSGGGLELTSVLQVLQERQIRSVLLEAGSALNGAFLAADLVDRAVLYFSELELGVGGVPFASGGESVYALQAGLKGIQRRSFPHGASSALEDVRISGYLHDPWSGIG